MVPWLQTTPRPHGTIPLVAPDYSKTQNKWNLPFLLLLLLFAAEGLLRQCLAVVGVEEIGMLQPLISNSRKPFTFKIRCPCSVVCSFLKIIGEFYIHLRKADSKHISESKPILDLRHFK